MAEQNFSMHSGDILPVVFTVQTSAGVAVDVSTAASIIWKLALTPTSAAIFTKTVGDGLTVDEEEVTWTPTAEDTEDLAGIYYHEMQIVDASGHKQTRAGWLLIEGDLIT